MLVRYIAIVLIAAVSLVGCYDGSPGRWEPYPICEECRDPELIVAPGIGFDLSLYYGTAAVRFQNGSIAYLGKVYGNGDFKRLMWRLSFEDSRPKEPETPWEKLKYLWDRQKRQLNKSRGLPATEDVGTIADLLIQLRYMTEMYLSHNISAAVTTIPYLPGLTREDLDDAMEHAGLEMRRSYNAFTDIYEVSAAYAGSGNGLCEHPSDIQSCEDEESTMLWQYVLSVSFTDAVLSMTTSACVAAQQCDEWFSDYNFDLGFMSKDFYNDETYYWRSIRRAIRRFAEIGPDLDRLQVLGEAASEERFLEALQGAIRDLNPERAVPFNVSPNLEPESLAARGAAVFAKRFQEMTWGCREPWSCNMTETAEKPVAEL